MCTLHLPLTAQPPNLCTHDTHGTSRAVPQRPADLYSTYSVGKYTRFLRPRKISACILRSSSISTLL